jgi:hypothetical protein
VGASIKKKKKSTGTVVGSLCLNLYPKLYYLAHINM